MVSFRYDAPEYSPAEVVQALSKAVANRQLQPDSYSIGGAVLELESAMAAMLGKERAVFMPTGTLANHLAIRALAVNGNRVLVQERSHIYQDSGDALTAISGFNLIPLGHHRVHYTLEEAKSAHADAGQTRVKTGIGALSIESPVRRCDGAAFDFREMARLTSWARENGIGTHLDGARLFIGSHYTKISVRDYASIFDTVYVSLYKYFGTPSGAILAGPAGLLDAIYHERRMFGGGLNQAWPFAGLALDALHRFDEEFAEAILLSETLIERLSDGNVFSIARVPGGSNVFGLTFADGKRDAGRDARFVQLLRSKQITMPESISGKYLLKVNTSLLGHKPAELASCLLSAAMEA
ncbi:MAG: beta-eliminating lyase-related protein [Burkholderiaceae bacterium]